MVFSLLSSFTFGILVCSNVLEATVYIASGPTIQKGGLLWDNRKTRDGRFWEIPYKIDPTFGSETDPKDTIYFETLDTVIKKYEDSTCLRFRRIPMENNSIFPYLSFQNKNGRCSSRIGRCKPEKQKTFCYNEINLIAGCRKKTMGTTHEIMHSLGWNHALSRPDREDYITIHWEHIQEDYKGCFDERKVKTERMKLKMTIADVTLDKCRLSCIQQNQLIFGIQSPDKCFCATSWNYRKGLVDGSQCPHCTYINSQNRKCGGGDRYYAVYSVKENFGKVKQDNGVGFPLDPYSVMMGGFMSASRYSERDVRYEQFPPITWNDGSEIVRPEKRTELSESDISMINQVYGCQPDMKKD